MKKNGSSFYGSSHSPNPPDRQKIKSHPLFRILTKGLIIILIGYIFVGIKNKFLPSSSANYSLSTYSFAPVEATFSTLAPRDTKVEMLSNVSESSPSMVANTSDIFSSQSGQKEPFPVYLSGAILTPGVYELDQPIYLYQLLQKAGGLSENAAKPHLNLVFWVDKSITIYIPTQAEIDSQQIDLSQLDYFHNDVVIGGWGTSSEIDNSPSSNLPTSNQKININQADATELQTLPGVGLSTANKILSYRQSHGNFKSIEDLMLVPGIKEAKFETLKDFITVK